MRSKLHVILLKPDIRWEATFTIKLGETMANCWQGPAQSSTTPPTHSTEPSSSSRVPPSRIVLTAEAEAVLTRCGWPAQSL
eukprot:5305826-Amphidinium_carterae.1